MSREREEKMHRCELGTLGKEAASIEPNLVLPLTPNQFCCMYAANVE